MNGELIESVELPMYVAVAYSSLNIHLAISEMNALARDGYRLVEKVEVWDKRKPDRHATPVDVNTGFFIMEWMPTQEISIEALSPSDYDPDLFQEATDQDAEALAEHVFVGDEAEREALVKATQEEIERIEQEMDADWDPEKDRVTTSKRKTKAKKADDAEE